MKHLHCWRAPLAALGALWSAAAAAYDIGSRANESSWETAIDRGAKQVGLEAVAVVDDNSGAGGSTLRITAVGTVSVGYFVRNNLAVGVDVGPYFKEVELPQGNATTESGGAGLLTARYFARLGRGFFLRSGAGVGAFYGQQETPQSGSVLAAASVYGLAAMIDVGLVFFASPRTTLTAAPRLLAFAGTDGSNGFVSLNGGFCVGLGYVF